ncbi:hypothetical protein NMG60_11012479 [Bertholletia excelsa]
MENNGVSTLLSMDSNSSSPEEMERDLNLRVHHSQPPDINLPLSSEPSPPPPSWHDVDTCDLLDVSLAPQNYEAETNIVNINTTKAGKKCAKRLDSVWGAWFFFSFYFKPALNEKSKCKITREGNGFSGYDKSDLKLDIFLVQHDMENMYMWTFKDKPENALGKMQLRSYMNGHSRQGERPFPFSVDKGFVRSHRMQRKHYRGLSNPQCIHGIEIVRSPNLSVLDEEEQRKWMELTGRDINFSIPPEASDFGSWRNLATTEFEIERPPTIKSATSTHLKRLPNSSGLDLLPISNKRRKNGSSHGNDDSCCLPNISHSDRILEVQSTEPQWFNEFTGVMRGVLGPVTAAKAIYESDESFLVIVSLPFVDLQRVKVTWRNNLSHGIVKITCVSIGCKPVIKRQDRTFKLTDPTPEHCPPGEFVREIMLPLRIPESAKLEAYCDETGTMLEIIVPKHRVGPEEHEVHVCRRPSPWRERAYVDWTKALV